MQIQRPILPLMIKVTGHLSLAIEPLPSSPYDLPSSKSSARFDSTQARVQEHSEIIPSCTSESVVARKFAM